MRPYSFSDTPAARRNLAAEVALGRQVAGIGEAVLCWDLACRDRTVINYLSQHAADSGGEFQPGRRPGRAADHDSFAARQDAAVRGGTEQPAKEDRRARLRKRGAVVAFATTQPKRLPKRYEDFAAAIRDCRPG